MMGVRSRHEHKLGLSQQQGQECEQPAHGEAGVVVAQLCGRRGAVGGGTGEQRLQASCHRLKQARR